VASIPAPPNDTLALALRDQGSYQRAESLHQAALALKRQAGDAPDEAAILCNLGIVARLQGDYTRASRFCEESREIYRAQGDAWGTAVALTNLGEVARYQGRVERAGALYRESLALHHELGHKAGMVVCLEGWAGLVCERGEPERTARFFGVTQAARDSLGFPLMPGDWPAYERDLDAARAAIDATVPVGANTCEAAWAAGATMTLEQAVGEVLDEPAIADLRHADRPEQDDATPA
jgi:tetratricopeptide (TPR) repeat protein